MSMTPLLQAADNGDKLKKTGSNNYYEHCIVKLDDNPLRLIGHIKHYDAYWNTRHSQADHQRTVQESSTYKSDMQTLLTSHHVLQCRSPSPMGGNTYLASRSEQHLLSLIVIQWKPASWCVRVHHPVETSILVCNSSASSGNQHPGV